MKHPIQEMMEQRRQGKKCGIPSYCTANPLALEIILKRAKQLQMPVLIEATANQVNQYGGYTGMLPKDFYEMIQKMAGEIGVPEELIILGGDHLGPLTWQNLPEKEAMEKSVELVYQYAKAGFTKIHLDTSMKVADDPEGLLSTETIARRGAELYKASMKGYEERKAEVPDAMRPVFIIGSEVPIPGGAQEAEDSLSVTSPEAFQDTVATYKHIFEEAGVKEGWKDVVAVVVQPGVEFGDDQVFLYDHDAATALCSALEKYPEVCFEGHSTDYQSAECLKNMVNDGIAILKVGPALTYGLREALFALSFMEKELVPEDKRADFIETLEKVMLAEPGNWQKHYHGDDKQLALARKYSFSDRARYYIGQPEVTKAIDKLFDNLREYPIPMNMLHQYMPVSYTKVRDGILTLDPKELALDGVANFMLDYEYAVVE
ncbi:MAG: class II D-tagatose-bisphosphate aldolase, non-catalytic subunit [Kineothrix sp.]|jgi:D-tagatose-1,6-bisphosphate aldolase subunit GatZ/KbaZ|nr:D-tagatose-bisphosphate aldolase, class II, non-catalytic subunit [Lachnospiraceae bacterium 28-4]MCI8847508.1 class II D-tagatose-bisphosphate aldolase, non-catalytic subunit [Lachnospiraceae bacterium]MCX4343684.1 class II D-tagatose-bisphosphate aldolase, non-catalytic subunit [Kineothrix sp.]